MKKTKLVIQQAENGTYFTQVSKGVRPDGKRNRRMFTGSTEDEVYFKATKWLKGIEEEERNPYTVREAMLQFIDSRSRVLEPTTLCCYREMLRNKLQYIMDVKIEDLTARDIQIAINVDAQRLGYKSIKNAVGFLRAVLNANDITIKMGSIRLPKKEVRERRLPSADVIYAIVKGTSSELPVLLAMWLSLRIGEVAGLQFCDIDPVQMRLYVRREIVKVDSGWAERRLLLSEGSDSAEGQRNAAIAFALPLLVPDSLAAAFTGGSVILQAVGADNLPVPFRVVIVINDTAAALTIQGFFLFVLFGFYFFAHLKFLRKMKIALPNGIGRALCLGLVFFC